MQIPRETRPMGGALTSSSSIAQPMLYVLYLHSLENYSYDYWTGLFNASIELDQVQMVCGAKDKPVVTVSQYFALRVAACHALPPGDDTLMTVKSGGAVIVMKQPFGASYILRLSHKTFS